MDQRPPVKLSGKHAAAVALLLLVLLLASFAIDYYALWRLENRLRVPSHLRFPEQYFRARIENGASVADVCQAMYGYEEIVYLLAPVAGTRDSVLVQQFAYPLVFRKLNVSVEYRRQQVTDVDAENWGLSGARIISVDEAQHRLSLLWSPSKSQCQSRSQKGHTRNSLSETRKAGLAVLPVSRQAPATDVAAMPRKLDRSRRSSGS